MLVKDTSTRRFWTRTIARNLCSTFFARIAQVQILFDESFRLVSGELLFLAHGVRLNRILGNSLCYQKSLCTVDTAFSQDLIVFNRSTRIGVACQRNA